MWSSEAQTGDQTETPALYNETKSNKEVKHAKPDVIHGKNFAVALGKSSYLYDRPVNR